MSKVFLKIKIKSLAAEARIIRLEENKFPTAKQAKKKQLQCGGQREAGGTWDQLNSHRRHVVRSAARESLLAYGFVRGRKYNQIEAKCYEEPNWIHVAELVKKYGPSIQNKDGKEMDKVTLGSKVLVPWRDGECNINTCNTLIVLG